MRLISLEGKREAMGVMSYRRGAPSNNGGWQPKGTALERILMGEGGDAADGRNSA